MFRKYSIWNLQRSNRNIKIIADHDYKFHPKWQFFKSSFFSDTLQWFLTMYGKILFYKMWGVQNILTTLSSWTPRWTSKRPSSDTSARSVYNVLKCSKVLFLHWLVVPRVIFKASALWADAFYKSKCPYVCLFVCLSVHFWGTV